MSTDLQKIADDLCNEDRLIQLSALESATKVIVEERNPPIDDVINLGIMSKCVDFLRPCYSCDIHLQSCSILVRITGGLTRQRDAVISVGAVPKLVTLLWSSSTDVSYKALQAISNIVTDNVIGRNLVLETGAMHELLVLTKQDIPMMNFRLIVITIACLCRRLEAEPPFELVKECIPTLARLLYNTSNEVVAATCYALGSIAARDNCDEAQYVIDAKVVLRLVELLGKSNVNILKGSLKVLGNLAAGYEQQVDTVIQAGTIPQLARLLKHSEDTIRKTSAWVVSNILAGTNEQRQSVVEAGIIPLLIDLLTTGDEDSQNEACWALQSFISRETTVRPFLELHEQQCLKQFLDHLQSDNLLTVIVVLDALRNVLIASSGQEEMEKIYSILEECDTLTKLNSLQSHNSEHIRCLADTYSKMFVLSKSCAKSCLNIP